MIVTLSGVTGTGKSFFKDTIAKELNFKNLAIVTTREKRKNEVNGIDKEFVSEEKFEELVNSNDVVVDFEFLGAKYGYRKERLESDENQVTEVHYSTIYEIKKHTPNIFSLYIIPKDIERAKNELKHRGLPSEVEKKRLQEIEEHIREYSTNKELQKQFDCVFVNDYTDEAKKKLINIIKERLKKEKKNKYSYVF